LATCSSGGNRCTRGAGTGAEGRMEWPGGDMDRPVGPDCRKPLSCTSVKIARTPALSCKNIRLSSDVANPLSRSRNLQADGDGCVVFACRCRGGGLNGVTVRTVGTSTGDDC